MKRLVSLLLISLSACLVGFTRVGDLSKDGMRLTGISDKILLVEITKVTLTDEKVTDGIGNPGCSWFSDLHNNTHGHFFPNRQTS